MKKTIVFLMTLYDPKDMLIAKNWNEGEYEYDFTDLENITVDNSKTYYLMTLLGDIIKVSNLEKVRNNKEALIKLYLDKIRDLNLQYKDKIQELLQVKEQSLTNKDIFHLISSSMFITALYQLTDIEIEEINKSDDKSNDVFEVMKECREEEVDEEEEDIRNELDIVNSLLKQHFTADQLETLEIEECTYNGEVLDQKDMIEELQSHVLPNFMIRQKDIRETKGDTYLIKTNLGLIYREKGSMEIKLSEKEGEEND